MKTTFIVILALWLVSTVIYQYTLIQELSSEVKVTKELHKACEADRLWKQIQLRDIK